MKPLNERKGIQLIAGVAKKLFSGAKQGVPFANIDNLKNEDGKFSTWKIIGCGSVVLLLSIGVAKKYVPVETAIDLIFEGVKFILSL